MTTVSFFPKKSEELKIIFLNIERYPYSAIICLNPFHFEGTFWHICSRQLLKTLKQIMEKLPIRSSFSFIGISYSFAYSTFSKMYQRKDSSGRFISAHANLSLASGWDKIWLLSTGVCLIKPFPHTGAFWRLCSRQKPCGKTRNCSWCFSFCHNVFNSNKKWSFH